MGWTVNATPRPLYPRDRPAVHCIGGRVGPRAGLNGCGKSRPIGIRSPDRPARSESLYRLSYPGPLIYYQTLLSFTAIFICRYCRLASGTRVRGFKSGRSRRIFSADKTLSMPSFGREAMPFAPCRRFAACKKSLRFTWESESQAKLAGHFSPDSVLH
jgi:hypothetical protein